MKPLPDNTGAQACNESGTTNITTTTTTAASPPSQSSSKNNNHSKIPMASSLAHGNNGSIPSNIINSNGKNSSNSSQKIKGKSSSSQVNESNNNVKKMNTKKMSSDVTSALSVVTNGSYSNGHSPSDCSTNGHSDDSNSDNGNDNNKHKNGGSHHHLPPHYHFPQHSPNGLEATTVLNLTEIETEDYKPVFLEYSGKEEEQEHHNDLLTSINTLRKQGQFCDIKLLVGEHEIPAHRAVLAASSPYLFDFLSCLEESECLQPIYRVKDVPYAGFQYLLDYMYTGKLHVPLSQVPVVYGTALVLRMEAPTKACADFLSSHLTEANCLVIRRFSRDNELRSAVDEYIRCHMDEILNSKTFFGLSNLQVEVVGLDESIEDEKMERPLFSLVLDWAKTNLNDLKPNLGRLTEQVNVLYLNPDNTLMDCADLEDSVLSSDDDVVMDYKKLARRRSKSKHTGSRSSSANGGIAQPFHKFSLNPEEAVSVAEREWSIIATHKSNENAYLSIAVLDGQLMAVSVHLRPSAPASTNDVNGLVLAPDSPTLVSHNSRGQSPVLRKTSIAPLEFMSTARCAMGAVELDGQIMVFGGYDRGECLQSVEAFSLQDNRWTNLTPMNAPRGRFSASALGGYVYTCGGSDGWKELSCVERFESATSQWKFVANMIKERSSHGVATLNGKLYCIGGSDGQRSIADCEVYNPDTNTWSRIASLNQARTQTCVCAFQGLLYAIGGTDLWNTLNTVEVYNPEVGEWIFTFNLNIARRGAGVDIVDGQLVVVGGSDGVQSLTSVEFYNPEMCQWTMGPPMITPRANLSAVTVGSRLFAIGGFSGKKFLSTMEWLDLQDSEWLGHAPKVVDLNMSIASSEDETNNGHVKKEEEKMLQASPVAVA